MTGDRAALDPPTVSSFVGWLETVFVWHPKCRYEAGAFLPFEAWFRRGKELAASLRPVRERLDDLSRPPLIVQASIGKAKTFTNTPWLGLRYNRATRNYYEGVFVQFLFCADMSGVYLQLTHGVGESGEAKEGSARPRREVIEEVTVLRDRFAGSQPLKAAGFGLMPPMNLHIPVGRSRVPSQYPDVTITYKFYRRDRLPALPAIESDLDVLLEAYDYHLGTCPGQLVLPYPETPAAILQALRWGALEEQVAELQAELSEAGEFAGATEGEVRDRTLRSVALRRGQPLFRERMLVRYGGRCAITGWSGAPALEAAHILPFCSGGADDDTNGLLLRADLHALFDVGLLAIDPVGMAVLLSPALDVTSYAAELRDARLRPADCGSPFPDLSLLRKHLTEAQRMWEDTDAA